MSWATASWWGGGALAVLGLAILAAALFRDRSRGRRRCPGCWYDMSGAVGMTCSECGRTQRKEKRFFRTRRRWRGVFAAGILLALASATAVAPAAYTGKWAKYMPVPILWGVMQFFDRDAEAALRVAGRGNVPATSWQRLLVAHAIGNRLRDRRLKLRSLPESTAETDGSASARGTNLWMLGDLNDEARPALMELQWWLGSGNNELERGAVLGVTILGKQAAPIVPAIARMAVSLEKSRSRIACLHALGMLGSASEPETWSVRRCVRRDPDPQVRLEACWTLAWIDDRDPACVADLGAAARDLSFSERARSLASLAWLAGSTNVLPSHEKHRPIFDTFRHAPEHRAEVEERAVEALVGFLDDPDTGVRRQAAWQLAGVGDRVRPHGDVLRRHVISETDGEVQRRLIDAWVNSGGADPRLVVGHVITAFESDEPIEWDWAIQKYRWCGPLAESAVPALRELVSRASALRRPYVCDCLAVAVPSGQDTLAALMEIPGELGTQAAKALSWMNTGKVRAVQLLLKCSRSTSSIARGNAAIGMSLRASDPAVEARLLDLARKDEDPGVRCLALGVLDMVDEGACVNCWAAAVSDEDESVRTLAATLLVTRARTSPIPRAAVAKLMNEGDERVHELLRRCDDSQ